MIDFVNTPTILESSVTGCHGNHAISHSLNQFIYGDILFAFALGPRKQFGTNSKLSLGCKVGQIRSRGRWFKAEISLFMMFSYDFHLIYKAFINILEYANEVISYTTTR